MLPTQISPAAPLAPAQPASFATTNPVQAAPGIKADAATPLASPSTAVSSPPRSARPTSTGSQFAGRKRTRDGPDDDDDSLDGGHPESRIGVKRACNECRQQKLKCNVQQDPYQPCDRCVKQNITCRIDANFKRVGKRKKNAEMEHENTSLHSQLVQKDAENALLRSQLMAMQQQQQQSTGYASTRMAVQQHNGEMRYPIPPRSSAVKDMLDIGDVANTMLDMRSGGSPGPTARRAYRLHDFTISADRVDELYNTFFTKYHPFLPLMNRNRGPNFFHEECPLLFWSMMAVAMRKHQGASNLLYELDKHFGRLLWATIADNKQHYLVIKALATICTWPLPVSSSDADTTPALCGVMVQLAKHIGLHRPSHAQDFERFKVELRDEELRDRFYTWAACNIVAQRVSTGYGLPPNTLYDWTLTMGEGQEPSFTLPQDVNARLKIEMFANQVSTLLYGDKDDPVGLVAEANKKEAMAELDGKLAQLEAEITNDNPVNRLYLLAARLHYRLIALFESPATPEYRDDLDKLWHSTVDFVETAVNLHLSAVGHMMAYSTNYIFQMLLGCGFVLLKLLNSFYAAAIDREYGRQLFAKVVEHVRTTGCMSNDLPARFAEVLAQLWQTGGRGLKEIVGASAAAIPDDSLQLKVRGRMSMSLVHDSVWRWRELSHVERDPEARDAILKRLTLPDTGPSDISVGPSLDPGGGSGSSSVASSYANNALAHAANANAGGNVQALAPPPASSVVSLRRSPTPVGGERGWGDMFNYDVFDPTGWMLNGQLSDFPMTFESDIFSSSTNLGM